MTKLNDYEFRPVAPGELKQFLSLQRYVFAGDASPSKEKKEEEDTNLLERENAKAAFFKGKIVATFGQFPFQMRFNGKEVRADGVTSVGTDPGHRRRGLVRKLVTDRLRKAYEEEIPASILWASMGAIYQRFGYGLASSGYRYQFDPRMAEVQIDAMPTEGSITRFEPGVAPTVVRDLYEEFRTPRNLLLHRPSTVWDKAYFGPNPNYHYAVRYDESGKPDGYISYRLREIPKSTDGPDQRLSVQDFVYLNNEAYQALWDYIRSHDLVKEVVIYAPLDDPATHMLLEPRLLHPRWFEGVWLRTVNVPKLTSSRSYPIEGSVCFEIKEDTDCPWNVGRFRVSSDGRDCEVTKSADDADFQISINGLASLLSGQGSLSLLCNSSRAQIRDRNQLPFIDGFFGTRYKPHCVDDF
ncbi:MAG: GNAT family N-acetyltransferase [Gammaproteobacteria bacterium]|nr:GNAT family N-acetyltransferase [Gammaproteobacteria bacterium]